MRILAQHSDGVYIILYDEKMRAYCEHGGIAWGNSGIWDARAIYLSALLM